MHVGSRQARWVWTAKVMPSQPRMLASVASPRRVPHTDKPGTRPSRPVDSCPSERLRLSRNGDLGIRCMRVRINRRNKKPLRRRCGSATRPNGRALSDVHCPDSSNCALMASGVSARACSAEYAQSVASSPQSRPRPTRTRASRRG